MFDPPTNQSSSRSKSATRGALHRRFLFPDPGDHGACARFRLRQKAFKKYHSRCPSLDEPAISQLKLTTLELYRQLNHLQELVVQQARIFDTHLASCTAMTHNIMSLIAAVPTFGAHHDTENVSCDALACANKLASYAFQPLHSTDSPAPAPLEPQSTSLSFSASSPGKSMSSTLPRLRGFFNKPKQKTQFDGS